MAEVEGDADMGCTEDSTGIVECRDWEADQSACMGSGIAMDGGIQVV